MPGVKYLHQQSASNTKPESIMGHSLQAVSLLVHSGGGQVAAIPLTSRIHDRSCVLQPGLENVARQSGGAAVFNNVRLEQAGRAGGRCLLLNQS